MAQQYKINFVDKLSSEELIKMAEDKRAKEMMVVKRKLKQHKQ